MIQDVILNIFDPAADRNRFLDIIFILPGSDVFQKLLRIVLIIDQDHGLGRVDRIIDPPHEDHPQNNQHQIQCGQPEHGGDMCRKFPPSDQCELDIHDGIGKQHRTDLCDDDILDTHISYLQRPEQL